MSEPDIDHLLEFLEEPETFVDLIETADSERSVHEIASALEGIGKEVIANSEIDPDELEAASVGVLYVFSEMREKPFTPQTA